MKRKNWKDMKEEEVLHGFKRIHWKTQKEKPDKFIRREEHQILIPENSCLYSEERHSFMEDPRIPGVRSDVKTMTRKFSATKRNTSGVGVG